MHSNRQAPSRDIARAFAQGNRIRHLLSGGHFRPFHASQTSGLDPHHEREQFRRQKPTVADFVRSGTAVVATALVHETVQDYLGMQLPSPNTSPGT